VGGLFVVGAFEGHIEQKYLSGRTHGYRDVLAALPKKGPAEDAAISALRANLQRTVSQSEWMNAHLAKAHGIGLGIGSALLVASTLWDYYKTRDFKVTTTKAIDGALISKTLSGSLTEYYSENPVRAFQDNVSEADLIRLHQDEPKQRLCEQVGQLRKVLELARNESVAPQAVSQRNAKGAEVAPPETAAKQPSTARTANPAK
jgi:hypothetical protein